MASHAAQALAPTAAAHRPMRPLGILRGVGMLPTVDCSCGLRFEVPGGTSEDADRLWGAHIADEIIEAARVIHAVLELEG